MSTPSLASRAINIARLEFNARLNEGQGRLVEAQNMERNLKNNYGNAAANNALARARRVIRQTHARQERARQVRQGRANNERVNARRIIQRVLDKYHQARARTGQALMAPVLRELNNLRWVPVANFKVKRGRSPSPVRSARRVKTARGYAGFD